MNLSGKVAIVTGAKKGIGAAISRRLVSEGAICICTSRSAQDKLSSTLVRSLGHYTGQSGFSILVLCDLESKLDRHTLIEQVIKIFGRVDILVNNAAFQQFDPWFKVSPESIFRHFEVNFNAPFDLMQQVLPSMTERKSGRIINITSSLAVNPSGPPFHFNDTHLGPSLYGATKAALNRLSIGIAAEVHKQHVAINCLTPEYAVLTETVKDLLSSAPTLTSDPSWQEEPIEVMAEAALALCLASPALTNGQVLSSVRYLKSLGRSVRSLDGCNFIHTV